MKISKTTIFFSGMFIGHFIISPIKDGRAKILLDRLTDSKTNLKNEKKEKEIGFSSDVYHHKYNTDDEQTELSNSDRDNRANQLNPNNDRYWRSRGHQDRPDNWENSGGGNSEYSQAELDNHANQMNSNNEAYHSSRK